MMQIERWFLTIALVMGFGVEASADIQPPAAPTAQAEAAELRELCASENYSELEFCNRASELTDAELVAHIDRVRQLCQVWIPLSQSVDELETTHPNIHIRGVPYVLSVACSAPGVLGAGAFLMLADSVEDLEEALERTARRIEGLQSVESTSSELKEKLGRGFVSLELQRESGQLKAAEYEALRDDLRRCEKAANEGPHVVASGFDYDDWLQRTEACVEASTDAVFDNAREEEPSDDFLSWLLFTGFVFVAVGIAFFVVSRRERLSGTTIIDRWRVELETMESEVEAQAREATSSGAVSRFNSHLARVAALRKWVDHFGLDARPHDVERSLMSAILSERDYTWFGYSDREPPPVASVSGSPAEMFERLARVTGHTSPHLERLSRP